jgi:hypothetical protein
MVLGGGNNGVDVKMRLLEIGMLVRASIVSVYVESDIFYTCFTSILIATYVHTNRLDVYNCFVSIHGCTSSMGYTYNEYNWELPKAIYSTTFLDR